MPHPRVGHLDISGQFWEIEQGAGVAILLQLLPQRGEAVRGARQGQRRLFIFFQRSRDQFRHADRDQKAACDTARKCVSAAGEDRQTGPQRIAGGGVRVAGQGVEKQIGMAVTSEMFG